MNKQNKINVSDELVKKIHQTKHPNIKQQTENTFRTSFTISESSIQIINKIKDYYGLSTKELMSIITEFYKNNDEVLQYIIQTAMDEKDDNIDGTVKTFVIKKDTKDFLEKHVWSISRDVLLDRLIVGFNIRFEQLIEGQKKAIQQISEYSQTISDLYSKLDLPDGDPIIDRIGLIEFAWQDLISAIEAKLNDNVPIDTNDIWQNC